MNIAVQFANYHLPYKNLSRHLDKMPLDTSSMHSTSSQSSSQSSRGITRLLRRQYSSPQPKAMVTKLISSDSLGPIPQYSAYVIPSSPNSLTGWEVDDMAWGKPSRRSSWSFSCSRGVAHWTLLIDGIIRFLPMHWNTLHFVITDLPYHSILNM